MRVSLQWTHDWGAEASKREIKPPYRYIKWALNYTKPRSSQSEEIFFEVPIDVQRLGDNYGDPKNGDRQIYCTHSDPPFYRHWTCQSGQGNQWEWEWWLTLHTFDASRTVIREQG